MKKRCFCTLLCTLIILSSCVSQKGTLTPSEQSSVNLFEAFKNYVGHVIKEQEDINDSTHLRYILSHFVFAKKQHDSSGQTISENDLSMDQLKSVKKELNIFYTYLQQNDKGNLDANLAVKPIRQNGDTFISSKLTEFQKENTFVFFDKRFPQKALGYWLFMPPTKNIATYVRIWSWTLEFKFGKYLFKALTGEEGYEYIFSPERFGK